MRNLLMSLFAGLLIPALAWGQEIPKATKEGKEALQKLVDACVAGGGLKTMEGPKGKQLTVADEDKLRATVAAHPELLTPALRDALVAGWAGGDTAVRAAYASLLGAYGREKQDELALAFAALFTAFAADRRGQYPLALSLYQEARERFETAKEPAWQAITFNNIGEIYRAQGEYAEALDYHRRALALKQKLYKGPHPTIATSLNNIGAVYGAQEEYAQALDYFQQALSMWQKLYQAPHPAIATSLNNIGEAYRQQGEYALALDYHRRALAMEQKLHDGPDPAIVVTLNNIGEVYRARGEYAQALDHLQRALAMEQKLYDGPHPDIARSLNNIGLVYHAQTEYALALDYHQRALAMEKKLYEGPHPDLAMILSNIAFVYDDQGEPARALHAWDEALQVLHLAPAAEPIPIDRLQARDLRPLALTVEVVFWRGLASEKTLPRKPAAAELRACQRTYALASDLLDRVRHETLHGEADRLHHGAEQSELTPHRVGLCRRLFELAGDPADLATAFRAAEQGRARVFLEALAASRAGLLGGVSPNLRDNESELLRRLREYDVRIEKEESKPGSTGTPLPKLWEGRQQSEADLQQLISAMEKQFPQYAALKYPKPCSVEEARACLEPNEVALLFVVGEQESHVLLLEARPAPGDPAHGVALYVIPRRDAIADGVAALVDPDTLALPARVRCLGAELYAQLLAPLAGRLRGKDLVVVPDGPLPLLPFELLIEGGGEAGGGHFLIETHRIRYAPSLTALHLERQWAGKRERQPDRLLWAIGDPIYDSKQGFAPLRYSRQELEAIRSALGAPPESLLLGKDASEARVRQASESGDLALARYVHFACHCMLARQAGRLPALVLSLVGNSGERDEYGVLDGFLRQDEITFLKLNADLVVLSACSTQGRAYAGEGAYGLSRTFLAAGSRGVVCSLWPVDDKETAGFMAALYTRLKGGRSPADALRDARLDMIRAGKPPLYWAPFILIGE
jgi:CHAT domain-containing protein/tetratricopeptide (TPR) repeat protein